MTPPRPGGAGAPRPVPPRAWAVGAARETALDPDRRRAAGAWFTPPDLARHLAGLADPPRPPRTVLDPACGGGAFLLAAAERWPTARLSGVEVDPVTAAVATTALQVSGLDPAGIQTGDALVGGRPGPADVVLGNPPFRSPLHRGTARDAARRRGLTARFGGAAGRHVDDAALFLLATAERWLAEDGVAVLVLPESVLATADADEVRRRVAQRCQVDVVWRDVDGTFPGVPTCAVRLQRTAASGTSARGPAGGTPPQGWGGLLADAVPRVTAQAAGDRELGAIATATADFRDAHYLLADHVREASDRDGPGTDRLVTVGMIDPAHLRWGERVSRFAKARWERPVVSGLPPAFRGARVGPKVLLATQTKVLEAVVDVAGDLLPSTPVITIRSDQPWHVAAALTSPVATAVAARRHAGAARSRGALKLSAQQVLALPIPAHGHPAWDEAAEAVRTAHRTTDPDRRRQLLLACGRLVADAHGVADATLMGWWADRLPRR